MFQKEGLRHFSAIIIVVMLVATQLIGLGTAVLADTNNNVQNDLVKVEQAIIEEKIFYQDSKLQEVAAQYVNVNEFLYHLIMNLFTSSDHESVYHSGKFDHEFVYH